MMAAVGFKLYFNVDYTDTLWVLAAIAAGGAAYCVIRKRRLISYPSELPNAPRVRRTFSRRRTCPHGRVS
ncbi:MAG: hypothetical protein ACLUSP_02530 [Christensenellales bacterium]